MRRDSARLGEHCEEQESPTQASSAMLRYGCRVVYSALLGGGAADHLGGGMGGVRGARRVWGQGEGTSDRPSVAL